MDDSDVRFVIDSLALSAWQTSKSKGFWETDPNDGEQIALMHAELSEGLEAIRKDLMSDHIAGFTGLEEELADVVIRVMQYSHGKKLRLADAILAKMAFNETRPMKHGGKKF